MVIGVLTVQKQGFGLISSLTNMKNRSSDPLQKLITKNKNLNFTKETGWSIVSIRENLTSHQGHTDSSKAICLLGKELLPNYSAKQPTVVGCFAE